MSEVKILVNMIEGIFYFNHNDKKIWNPSAMFEKLLKDYEGKKVYINIKISEV